MTALEMLYDVDRRRLTLAWHSLQYTKLSGECEAVGGDVERLFVGQEAVLSTVSEADRALLAEQLSGMQVRHAVVAGVIATRLEALRDAVRCHEKALEKAKDSAKFVAAVHSQLKDLSRPIGSRVEDVQGLLDNYQVSADGGNPLGQSEQSP